MYAAWLQNGAHDVLDPPIMLRQVKSASRLGLDSELPTSLLVSVIPNRTDPPQGNHVGYHPKGYHVASAHMPGLSAVAAVQGFQLTDSLVISCRSLTRD
jgi:hypothetical protein